MYGRINAHPIFKGRELRAVYNTHDKGLTHVFYTRLVITITYSIVFWRALVNAVMNPRVP
jgi:hypothetical protein